MREDNYPRNHEGDLWNAHDWMFLPVVSVGTTKAAEMLGISRYALLRKADSMGFTVLRDQNDRRFFLLSEIAEVKQMMENLTGKQAREMVRRDQNEIIKIVQRK